MTAKILWDIKYLSFHAVAKIDAGEFIISNDSSLRETFYTDNVLYHVGRIHKKYSKKDAFAYSEFDFDTKDKSPIDIKKELAKIAGKKLDHLKIFLSHLWFVKDNSVCILNSIIFIPDIEHCVLLSTIKSLHCNCKGQYETVVFSEMEMIYVKSVIEKVDNINSKTSQYPELPPIEWEEDEGGNPIYSLDAQADKIDYGKFNCIDRAIVFLLTARKTEYLVYKIAYYIPVLECLFTTDKSEVMHKVRERLALYLEEDLEERIKIFDFIKDAYDIRSTFLHGQKFHSKEITRKILEPMSIRLDELLRAALVSIIMVDSDIFIGLEIGGNKNDKIEKRIKFLKNIALK